MNDHGLLQEYVCDGAESAFTQLVGRYINLVYSTAHRLVRDPHLAEDVTQHVFALLARKAHRLGSDTILSAWLYRTARHVASEALRREIRWRRRQQLAVETMNPPAYDVTWHQTERLLDGVMAKLSAVDHDAIVLRYFENRSLREVGAALGLSEDAAQKRVARALERLRIRLSREGVTASAAAVAAVLSNGAVQSAPVGLAGSVSASILSGASGPVLISKSLEFMATTNVKLIASGAIIAILSGSLVLLYQQNSSLRRRLTELSEQADKATVVSPGAPQTPELGVSRDELRQFQREHLEVLTLRGRVTQLANELRRSKSATAEVATSENATPETQADSILFTAALTNRVTNGHTLVVGGWSKAGMRGYLLLTPRPLEADGNSDKGRLTVQSQVIQAPEKFWDSIGWGPYKSEARRSNVAGVLSPAQITALLQALRAAEDGEISNISPATGPDGERMGFTFVASDQQEAGVLMELSVRPQISPGGGSVDLELWPSPVSPDTAIHSSLKGP